MLSIEEKIIGFLKYAEGREDFARRGILRDSLASNTVPELKAYLAAQGIRFTSRAKREDVIAEFYDIYV